LSGGGTPAPVPSGGPDTTKERKEGTSSFPLEMVGGRDREARRMISTTHAEPLFNFFGGKKKTA